MRRALLALLLGSLAACTEFDPGPPDRTKAPRQFVTNILDVMAVNSARRDLVDWPALRDTVLGSIPARAITIGEVLPAVALALELHGDNNSWLQLPDGSFLDYLHTATCTATPGVNKPILDSVGYLRVGPVHPPTSTFDPYMNAMQDSMRVQDDSGRIGWIVDLRNNDASNLWIGLAAIWPFLQGTVGFFLYNDSSAVTWQLFNEVVYINGAAAAWPDTPYSLIESSPRVAVLTDASTSYYGEGLAIAFRGRDRTRSFGTATCGITTGVAPFALGNNYTLGLGVVTMADRTGLRYDGPVVPDEVVTNTDSILARAIAWLRTPEP